MPLSVWWPPAGHTSLTESVAFGLMLIGVREITEENVEKVHERFWKFGKVSSLTVPTREELQTCIGLRTNVGPMTDTKFKNHLIATLNQRYKEAYK